MIELEDHIFAILLLDANRWRVFAQSPSLVLVDTEQQEESTDPWLKQWAVDSMRDYKPGAVRPKCAPPGRRTDGYFEH